MFTATQRFYNARLGTRFQQGDEVDTTTWTKEEIDRAKRKGLIEGTAPRKTAAKTSAKRTTRKKTTAKK
jgi:hypothetical protein